MPQDLSLAKSHHQKFLKRLRYFLDGRQVKYYHCGEYGDETERPHYHTLLFGFDFPDKIAVKECEGYTLFISKALDEIWQYGHCWLGSVSFKSAAYVARYCLKKVTGDLAHDHYLRFDDYGVPYQLEPEYATMSRSEGIGKGWYEKFHRDMYPLDRLPIPGRGTYGRPPRYYDELHSKMFPAVVEAVKAERREFWEQFPEEASPSRLAAKEEVKLAQVRSLQRGLESC